MGKQNKKISAAAVIDIGTNALRLKIAQAKRNKQEILEDIRYPLSLGSDTFSIGKISFEKSNKLCEIITNFIEIITEYEITNVMAVATTALREAANKNYILDQIKVKTGINVIVLDEWEEKNYVYRQMSRLISESKQYEKAGLMAYIGYGSIGVCIYDNGCIPFTQSIEIGSLRITELLETIQDYTDQFYIILEEYICSFIDVLNDLIPNIPIYDFFASGNEIALIAKLCNAPKNDDFICIDINKFNELYDYIKFKSVDQIMLEYNIQEDEAEVLLPTMSIFKVLSTHTKNDEIIIPLVFMRDAILFDMLFPERALKLSSVFTGNTLLCARTLAAKYMYDEQHSRRVEKFALKIFDKMKKIHGLSSRERLLLQTSAILHDIGKFISLKKHYKHSFNIIFGSDIIGLSLREIKIVAYISRYHSHKLPNLKSRRFSNLSSKEKNLISKLSAILRLADSLDRSHLQKFDNIEVKIIGSELFVEITTFKNIQIEEWAFERKGQYFEDIFGIKPYIKKKKVI